MTKSIPFSEVEILDSLFNMKTFKVRHGNSKPKLLEQYKKKYPDAISIIVRQNGQEYMWVNDGELFNDLDNAFGGK